MNENKDLKILNKLQENSISILKNSLNRYREIVDVIKKADNWDGLRKSLTDLTDKLISIAQETPTLRNEALKIATDGLLAAIEYNKDKKETKQTERFKVIDGLFAQIKSAYESNKQVEINTKKTAEKSNKQNTLNEINNDINTIKKDAKGKVTDYINKNTADLEDLEKRVQALNNPFIIAPNNGLEKNPMDEIKLIHDALYQGETTIFKRRSSAIDTCKNIDELKSHAQQNPNSRSAKALQLWEKHKDDGINKNNANLLKDIHTYARNHSGFFSKSRSDTTGNLFENYQVQGNNTSKVLPNVNTTIS